MRTSRGRTLDASILAQGTNQEARHESRKRPDPPTEARRAGTCHDGRAAGHGQLINAGAGR